jgi:hypothetical protein
MTTVTLQAGKLQQTLPPPVSGVTWLTGPGSVGVGCGRDPVRERHQQRVDRYRCCQLEGQRREHGVQIVVRHCAL